MTRTFPGPRSCEAGLGCGVGRDPRPSTGSLPGSHHSYPAALPSSPPSPLSSQSFHPGLGASPPPTFSLPQLHGMACGHPVSRGPGPDWRWEHSPQQRPPRLDGCGVPGARLPGMSRDFLPSAPFSQPTQRGTIPSCLQPPPPPQACRCPISGTVGSGVVTTGSLGEAWRAEGTPEAPERILGCSYNCMCREKVMS